MPSLKVENLSLLAGEEISLLREIYYDNLGTEDEPKLMGCLMAHFLMTMRSVADLTRSCVVFEGMLEDEAEEWLSETF